VDGDLLDEMPRDLAALFVGQHRVESLEETLPHFLRYRDWSGGGRREFVDSSLEDRAVTPDFFKLLFQIQLADQVSDADLVPLQLHPRSWF